MLMTTNYRNYKHSWIFDGALDEEVKMTTKEAKDLLSRGGFMIRNVYDFDCDYPTNFWYIIKDYFGGMDELSSKTRNQIRRGLSNYVVRRVSKDEMLQYGYPIQVAATESYKVYAETPSRKAYNARINNATDDIEYWGAFDHEGVMKAFSINKIEKRYCEYQTMKAIPADMRNYVYYALIYEMNRYYLEERKLEFVNDGARSITEHSNIQPFLEEKFHFRKAYIRNNQIHAVLTLHGMQG